ncbi:MAG: tetratricopeptide repeat protein [Bacteroidales bacterium]|nr:tetratricopeptide repeat protein [Bacteroidales bacterium]
MIKLKGRYIVLFTSFILSFSLLYSSISYSQKLATIDSLLKLLDKTKDSSKVAILRQLSWEYRSIDTSKAISFGKASLNEAIRLNLKYEQTDIMGRLGVYKRNQGNYSKAMDYYFKSLEIAQKNNFLKFEALGYNNIGDIYNRLGIYDQALDYVHKALNISTKLNDKYNLSYIYHMFGLIYMNSSNTDSALISFRKSLYYQKGLKLRTGIASSYQYIGMIHFKKANYDSSHIYYNRALEIFNQMNDRVGIANVYKCIGEYYNQRGNYKSALEYFTKSMQLIKVFGGIPQVNRDAAEGLKYTYTKLGDFEKALYYHEFATKIKDSISNNIYIQKITRLTENFKFDIKAKEHEIIQKQKEEILNERIRYQRNQLNFFIIVSVLMVVLVGIIIFFYRDKNLAYKALNLKKDEVTELNNGLIIANIEIKVQKKEIENQRDILQKQSDDLTQLNFTKDKLFSIIAHDLRVPFNSIIGFSDYIKANFHQLSLEEIKEMNGLINQTGITTLRILENLLNWAKTQINQVTIYKENVNISTAINEIIKDFYPQANNKKIKLIYETTSTLNVYIDRNMVNTILRNLISNSIKYTKLGGEIFIMASQKDDYVEICIQDNGVGMSTEIKTNLFTSNVNPSTIGTLNEKGTGLGLAICNEFVKKLDGKIWVESEVDKGSTFKFTLPLAFKETLVLQ